MSTFDFASTSSKLINVEEKALLKAKQLFKGKLDETKISTQTCTTKREIDKYVTQMKNIEAQRKEIPEAKMVLSEENWNHKQSNVNSFGFSTARGNSIKVSEKALSKAQQLLIDVTEETKISAHNSATEPASKEYEMKIQNTASRNTVLQEAQNILPDENCDDVQNNIHSFGFKTARGNSIKISEKALLKAQLLMDESEEIKMSAHNSTTKPASKEYEMKIQNTASRNTVLQEAQNIMPDENCDDVQDNIHSFGFKTARGNSIKISEKALLKAQLLMDEPEEIKMSAHNSTTKPASKEYEMKIQNTASRNTVLQEAQNIMPDENCDDVQNNIHSFGFKTARGNSIKISEKALLKAQLLMDEPEEIKISAHNSTTKPESKEYEMKIQNTASRNKVLQEAQNILPDENCDDVQNNINSFGFKTARGNSIKISEKALSKAQLLMDESEEIKMSAHSSATKPASKEYEMKIQNTASRNTVLQEAQNIMPDENCDDVQNNIHSFGFKTARGNSIKISEKALLKAQLLMDEPEEIKISAHNSTTKPESKEYEMKIQNTASRNKVLQEAQNILPDENCDDVQNNIHSFGFKTARGNSIKISEKALSKAEQLLIDETEGTKISTHNSTTKTKNKEYAMKMQNIKSPNKLLQEAKEVLSDENCDDAQGNINSWGFTTALGNSINVSERALSKAKELLTDELEKTESNKCDTNLQNINMTEISNVKGFPDRRIRVPVKLLPEIKQPFIDKIPNVDILKQNSIDETRPDKLEIQRYTNISKKSSIQVESSFSKETLKNSNSNAAPLPLVQKRKIVDIDDNVPVDKYQISNNLKKLRFSHEFQTSKVTDDNFMNEQDENKTAVLEQNIVLVPKCNYNKLNDCNYIRPSSNEIASNANAPVTDGRNNVALEQLSPMLEMNENAVTLDIPSSPVIGSQFITKKRRSGRKKRANSMYDKKLCNKDGIEKHSSSNSTNIDNIIIQETITKEEERNEKKCDISIENEFGDSQLMLDFINQSADILQKRLEAALDQEKQINLKKRFKPKPIISKLYFHKKCNPNNRVTWKDISNGSVPILRTREELINEKLSPEILHITADTAISHKFRCADFYGSNEIQNNINGIKMEDGACLILDENGYVGIAEIKRAFLASPGVDPTLLPPGWLENHYRWIVWKLASVDRIKLGVIKLPRALTPAEVMAQLKYRYDREIDRSQRSALRKILEKDDVPCKRMVLCVSSIVKHDNATNKSPTKFEKPSKKLVLTDGWYSISTVIDHAMIANVIRGKVKEGTKLLMYGSELLNCDQGCSPLEVPDGVCLKIHTNSTRRARWDTKLGYRAPPGPMCVKLKHISPDGGLIGKITVSIARLYPMLYYEKTPAGESIFRNARCEEKANIAYEKERQSKIEAFYAKAEKYFYVKKESCSSKTDSLELAAVEWNEHRERLSKEEFLSQQEQEQLLQQCRMKEEKFKRKLESRLLEILPLSRQVTPLLKVRVIQESTNAILSIWSPNEELTDVLKEGNFVSVSNLTASGNRAGKLQLNANRNAVFQLKTTSKVCYPHRMYTALHDIVQSSFAPVYGEFDTVGIVVTIENEPCGMKNFEAVYLAHPSASSSSYLSILFWNGVTAYGYAEILTIGSFVACSNLEWRRATSWNIPMAYCTERSIFTCNPRRNHLQRPFEDLKCLMEDVTAYIAQCKLEIMEEIQKKSTSKADYRTPDKNTASNSDKQFGNFISDDVSSQNLATRSRELKSADIQRRLEKLRNYGDAPSISPIVLRNSSKRVSLNFKSPIRSSDVRSKNFNPPLNTNLL